MGVFEVDEPFAGIQIRDSETINFAEQYLESWWIKHYKDSKEESFD